MGVMRAAVLLLAVAACGSKERRGDGPSCEERAARMEARLATLAAEPGQLMVAPEGVTTIESSRGAPIDGPGPVVTVRRDGALDFQGEPLGAPEQLTERLAMERELVRWPIEHLYVLADRDAPASVIAAVLAAAAPASVTARLAVRAPARPTQPYDEALRKLPSVIAFDKEMDGADPSERATRLAKTIEPIVAGCPPIVRVYGSVASTGDKAHMLAEGTPRAMRECRCKLTDPDLFEYALLKLFGAWDRPMRWLPLDAVPAGARTAADLAR